MLVHEVMSRDVVTTRPSTTVKHALALLAQHRVTALPVVTGTGELCGIVSEADLIRDLLARDPRAHEIPQADVRSKATNVEEVMSGHPVTVRANTDLAEAVDLLTSTTVKSLPVVDHAGRLEGVLSRSDIVRLLARADEDIEREVDELLRSTGLEDWLVEVTDGSARLLGPEGTADTLVVRLLAETVPGVIDVTTRTDRES
jgi:CBS-domain-containing membrane protein